VATDVLVNRIDSDQLTPLHIATVISIFSFSSHNMFKMNCGKEAEKILSCLLSREDIDVNVKDPQGNTPLHFFCREFKVPKSSLLSTLLKKGGNVNDQNNFGETPLHMATFNTSMKLWMIRVKTKRLYYLPTHSFFFYSYSFVKVQIQISGIMKAKHHFIMLLD